MNISLPARAGLFSLSPEKERNIGAEASKQIEAQAPIVTGPVADWVESVGQKLVKKSNPEFKYSFRVIESPEINAFALPGGYVYVYTGLRKVASNDDELAAVLAHEITHAEEHHYASQYKKSSRRGLLLGVGSLLLG
ncbi:MAG: M48 family metalloprotease, partial [Acidimicrobiales bacterium]